MGINDGNPDLLCENFMYYIPPQILSSKFVGFQLLAYIYRLEKSVDLVQQADFDSSRMFT